MDFAALLKGIGTKVTGVAAGSAAALSLIGWVFPPVFAPIGVWAMLAAFAVAFLGLPVAMVSMLLETSTTGELRWSWSALRRRDNQNLASYLRRVPAPLLAALGVICALAAVSAVIALADSGGYSQNPKGDQPRCEWSIGTNHGATNLCVSRARWLRVGDDFTRGFLGLSTVFLSVECCLFARRPKKGPEDPANTVATT